MRWLSNTICYYNKKKTLWQVKFFENIFYDFIFIQNHENKFRISVKLASITDAEEECRKDPITYSSVFRSICGSFHTYYLTDMRMRWCAINKTNKQISSNPQDYILTKLVKNVITFKTFICIVRTRTNKIYILPNLVYNIDHL